MFQHTQDPKQSQLHQWDTAHNPSTRLLPRIVQRTTRTNARVRASLPGTAFLNRDQEMSFERAWPQPQRLQKSCFG